MVIVSPDFQKKMTLARHKMGKCVGILAVRLESLADVHSEPDSG